MPTLLEQRNAARAEAIRLEFEIQACRPHDWNHDEPHLAPMRFPRGESTGGGSCWVRQRNRTCRKCGLKEIQIQTTPDDQWGPWHEPH